MQIRQMAHILPDTSIEEMEFLNVVMRDLEIDEKTDFLIRFRNRRRKKDTVLIMVILGLFGVAGIHRFYLRNPLLGVLYLITCGFFFIGTVIDLINHRSLVEAYNEEIAVELRDEY